MSLVRRLLDRNSALSAQPLDVEMREARQTVEGKKIKTELVDATVSKKVESSYGESEGAVAAVDAQLSTALASVCSLDVGHSLVVAQICLTHQQHAEIAWASGVESLLAIRMLRSGRQRAEQEKLMQLVETPARLLLLLPAPHLESECEATEQPAIDTL